MKSNILKKLCILFLSLLLVFTSFPMFAQADSNKTVSAAYLSNHNDSIKLYQTIVDNIDKGKYGGMYLDDQGILNINTTDMPTIKSYVAKFKSDTQTVLYNDVKYSYKQLENCYNKLFNSMDKLGISAIDIDEKNDCINVGVCQLSDVKKQTILSSINEDFINFYDLPAPLEDTISLNCGATGNVYNGWFTLTCGATWTSGSTHHYGFLSMGHDLTVGETVTNNGYTIGTVQKIQVSGSVDAALIERSTNDFHSTYSFMDLSTYNSPASSYVSGGFPTGTAVTMYGASSGTLTGTILSTTWGGTIEGVKFTNLVKASYVCSGGDSGGPIKIIYGTNPTYTYVAGINKATASTYSVYTDMNKAKSAMGFTGYVG